MKLLDQVPEIPIAETWQWDTDVIVSDNGTEQRISLMEFPKRSVNLTIGMDTEAEVNKVAARVAGSGEGLAIPFYQAATRLTASAAAGAGAISFNASRTDVRSGAEALIFDRAGRVERVRLAVVSAAGATLAQPLAGAWSRKASIAPIWDCYASGSLAITRNNPDYIASLKASFTEVDFMEPFANEFAAYEFRQFKGYPVLEVNATGSEFEQSYETGATTQEYGQRAFIRNPWLHSQIVMPRQFLCQRVLQPESWRMWRALGDYAKGSTNPFFVPTFRNDFEVLVMPGGNANTVIFKGVEYAEEYAPFEPYRQFAFFLEDGGVQLASLVDFAIIGGNTVAHFTPALPAGVNPAKKCSLLLKVRIADDRISCEHNALHTMLSINLRTAD